jgi:hypothetical protein
MIRMTQGELSTTLAYLPGNDARLIVTYEDDDVVLTVTDGEMPDDAIYRLHLSVKEASHLRLLIAAAIALHNDA